MDFYKDSKNKVYSFTDLQVANGIDSDLTAITQEEADAICNPAPTLENCRCAKLAEMRKECDDAIATLFQSDALGTDKTYSYDCREIDQLNLQSIVIAGNGGSIYVHDGQWFNEVGHTHEQSATLLSDMLEHIRVQRFDKLKPIIAAINAATTNDEINAITWS